MLARKCTMDDMDQALSLLNKTYKNNIRFYDIRQTGKNILFRLKTQTPGIGTARSAFWKRSGSACWHAHGHFFEALFKVNPEALVTSKIDKITKDYGNWTDFNVGSNMNPVYASEACDCHFSEEIMGHLADNTEIIKHIQGLTFEGIKELMYAWGYRYGDFFLQHCNKKIVKSHLQNLSFEDIEKLITEWGDQYGNFFLQHCNINVIPLFLPNDKYRGITSKRLRTMKG